MKLLVVGATYMDNFGDMLFAKLILDRLKDKTENRFYLTSDYCKNFIGSENLKNFNPKDADALLYMPGGYLGDRSDTSLYTTYLWFKRYFPIGLYFAKKKKPILILAVDAGPCKYWFMRKVIRKICQNTTKVIVRNSESKNFLVNKIKLSQDNIFVTSDYAQTILNFPIPENSEFEKWKNKEKKQILLHINECEEARKVILPALKSFYVENSKKYEIVVASDQHYANDGKTFEEVKKFAGEDVYYYKYSDNPLELCSVIKSCDCVITYKLHVGIVASTYSKSVIPVPQHYKKVQKYYNQIGYGERVIPLKDANVENVFEALTKYVTEPIILSKDIYEKAEQNNSYLNEYICEIRDGVVNEK